MAVHGQTPSSFSKRGSRPCVHSSLIAFLHCLCQGINKGLKGRIIKMCLDRWSGENRFGTSMRYVKNKCWLYLIRNVLNHPNLIVGCLQTLMPISLPTATGFVPCASIYFQEGKGWVFEAGISRSDAINKQVVLKCLCLIWHVAESSALPSHWLRIWLVAFVPSTLCYKKITLKQSSNVKVLKGTPKIILAISLFCCGWGNRLL